MFLKWNETALSRLTKEIYQFFFSKILLGEHQPETFCDWPCFVSTKSPYEPILNIKDVQNGAILPRWLSGRPSHPLKWASIEAVALTNAFFLLCGGTMDCIVLGFISYLMQCNSGDKINQTDDTILDLKDESSSRAIAERIYQCWLQEVIEVKSLCNKTNLSRAGYSK